MSENLDNIIQSTQRLVRRAQLRLYWENYAPTLAPGFLALGLFILGAWLGAWQWIGDPIRLIALIITVFFLARSILRALRLRVPTYSDARRRVETDSQQAHRPLDVLDDRPALSADLWPAHQKSALKQAKALKAAQRRPALSLIDPPFVPAKSAMKLGLTLPVIQAARPFILKTALMSLFPLAVSSSPVFRAVKQLRDRA